MIEIEILYIENCPHYTKACSILCDIIAEQNLNANIDIRKVETPEYEPKFRGSPTVLINGLDVELCFNGMDEMINPDATLQAISCRLYDCDIGIGCPSHEMVRCALKHSIM